MYAKLAECYYHPGRAASQTCQECGAFICRDCAVKDERGRILCVSCANEALKLEHKEYRKLLKAKGGRFTEGKEFILPSIIGIIISAVFIVFMFIEDSPLSSEVLEERIVFVALLPIAAFWIHCIPYGIIMINDLCVPKYERSDSIIDISRLCIRFFAFMCTPILGLFSFLFYFMRFLVKNRKEKNV